MTFASSPILRIRPEGARGAPHRSHGAGRLLTTLAATVVFLWAWAVPGVGSLRAGYVIKSASGRVVINLSAINGLAWDVQFQSVHEAEAIDVVRRDLLRAQRIRDLPIVARWSDNGPLTSSISHERECRASYGEFTGPGGQEEENIGECYLIVLAKYWFEDLLAMTVALPELSPRVQRIDVNDPAAFRSTRSGQIQQYRSLELHFDPIWSPDGRRLLYTVWEPGRSRFELLEPPSTEAIKLEPLDAHMATRPVWSSDSRFTAYASLSAIRVFDTRTRTTRTLQPKELTRANVMLLQFEGTRLRFGFDTNFYGNYEVYSYDAVRQELQHLVAPAAMPGREEGHDMERHASLQPVRSTSSAGYIAVFTFVNGQRRIVVKVSR